MSIMLYFVYVCYIGQSACRLDWIVCSMSIHWIVDLSVIFDCLYVCNFGLSVCLLYLILGMSVILIVCMSVIFDRLYVCYIGLFVGLLYFIVGMSVIHVLNHPYVFNTESSPCLYDIYKPTRVLMMNLT